METMTFGQNIVTAANVYTWAQEHQTYWNCVLFRRDPMVTELQLAYVTINSSGVATSIVRTNSGVFQAVGASVAYDTTAASDDVFFVLRPHAV